MFIKSLCGEAREKILSFCFTFEMCSRACNIRRRGLIVLYCKEISACAERSDQEEIWQRCFFCFFLLSSRNSHFSIIPFVRFHLLADHNPSLSRARIHFFFCNAIGKNKSYMSVRLGDRWIVMSVGNGSARAWGGSEFRGKMYNSMGPVQVSVKFATSST